MVKPGGCSARPCFNSGSYVFGIKVSLISAIKPLLQKKKIIFSEASEQLTYYVCVHESEKNNNGQFDNAQLFIK